MNDYDIKHTCHTIQRKIFFRRSFFLYSPCPNLEGIKDALFYKFRRPTIGQNCSAVCTTRVAIEMCSRMNGAKRRVFREACSAGHRASSEARDKVCSSSEPGGRFDRVRTSPLQWLSSSSCSLEPRLPPKVSLGSRLEQLLLTCIEGCGLQSNTNKFQVRAAAASWHAHYT